MKIAQVNTHTYGGASIVAKRIHQALLDSGHDSLLVTKYGTVGAFPNHLYFKDGRFRNFIVKLISKPFIAPIADFLLGFMTNSNLAGRPEGFEIFSTQSTAPVTDQYDPLQACDIIHLHWINDFFDYAAFFEKFKDKKFIWTLHDMNPFTGGCHHSDGCLKFESVCLQCPQLKNTRNEDYSQEIQQAKQKALNILEDDQMIVVSPSHWLSDLSKRSQLMKRFKHEIVLNPSFKNVINDEDRAALKRQLGLPAEKKIILFASGNLNNSRKGIDILFQAVRTMADNKNITLVGIGHEAKSQAGLDIIYTGSISSAEILSYYYTAADIFVTPSLAENSPLVVIESLCCGTPVVGSRIGGIPDLINETNGILFTSGQTTELAVAIHNALFEKAFDRNAIRQKSLEAHEPSVIAGSYVRLYKALLSE